jgi:endonuclease YncB( thermonuclease family)
VTLTDGVRIEPHPALSAAARLTSMPTATRAVAALAPLPRLLYDDPAVVQPFEIVLARAVGGVLNPGCAQPSDTDSPNPLFARRGGRGAMMVRMKPTRLVLILLFALPCPAADPVQSTAKVLRVIDGDTVVVLLDGKQTTVRLIGVDTPESVDPRKPVQRFGHEAAEFLRGLVEGKPVRLSYEPAGARLDRYGRTLAYLRLEDGTFINRELVARGYAFALTKYPFAYMDDFRAAERAAREKALGLWGPDPAPEKATAETIVYVTATGKRYHRAGCRALAKSSTAMPLGEVEGRYKACTVCDPPKLAL